MNKYAVWVEDNNTIVIYERDGETGVCTDVYDCVEYPDGLDWTQCELRMSGADDEQPEAVELWKIDHDGGIAVCVWYHIF